MTTSTTRRRFIEICPTVGVALLVACSPKSEPTATSAPVATPSPAPAPVSAPASEPAVAVTPATPATQAATPANAPMVDPKDPQALALGYVDEATHADKVKFKTYTPGSQCASCALYLGKVGDAAGGCPLFAGKQVAAQGWCGSWVKKA